MIVSASPALTPKPVSVMPTGTSSIWLSAMVEDAEPTPRLMTKLPAAEMYGPLPYRSDDTRATRSEMFTRPSKLKSPSHQPASLELVPYFPAAVRLIRS